MEPAGQTMYSRLPCSPAPREGLHFTHCTSPAASDPGPPGAERGQSSSRWPNQPRSPRAPVCSSQ